MRDPQSLGTWLHGEPFDSLVLAPGDPWLARADAVFETLRIEAGRPMFIDRHLARLERSVNACLLGRFDRHRVDAALDPALEVAAEQTAPVALRIVAAAPSRPDGDLRLVASLAHYDAPSPEHYATGVSATLVDLPHPQLGAWGKSVSWQWSEIARRQARVAGFDDALVGRPGYAIESATAALIWREGDAWFTPPLSDGPLPSVSVEAVRSAGYVLTEARASMVRLQAATAVVLVSSLRLAMGVRQIGDVTFVACDDHAAPLRRALLALHGA